MITLAPDRARAVATGLPASVATTRTGRGKARRDTSGAAKIAIGEHDVDAAWCRLRQVPDHDAAHRAGAADDGDAGVAPTRHSGISWRRWA